MAFTREFCNAATAGRSCRYRQKRPYAAYVLSAVAIVGVALFSAKSATAAHSGSALSHTKAPLFASAPPGQSDRDGFQGTVSRVLRGDLVQLDDGRELRLAGVQAPLPEGRGNAAAEPWPGFADARAALESLTLGKKLWIVLTSRHEDRHGRLTALLYDGEGRRSLQEKLLESGWLRYAADGSLAGLDVDYAGIEAQARLARRGLWGFRAYRVWPAEEAGKAIGRFGIVEGQVLSAALVRKRLYLNFGEDWRQDFTAMIDASAQKAFAAAELDPQSYEGQWLRIRGWIKSYNGAMIEVETPQQIEVLKP